MCLLEISLSKKDFAESNWQDVVDRASPKDINRYASLFSAKAQEAKLNNLKKYAVFTLLAVVSAPPLQFDQDPDPLNYLDQTTEPLDYFGYCDNNEGIELIYNHLNILEDWASEISDAELRARIAEFVWFFSEEPSIIPFAMPKLAVDSYLESAKNLENLGEWDLWFTKVKRAVHLAWDISYHFPKVIAYIEEILNKYEGEDSFSLSNKLEELLQECKKEIFPHLESLDN